jgi:hypothetical protein
MMWGGEKLHISCRSGYDTVAFGWLDLKDHHILFRAGDRPKPYVLGNELEPGDILLEDDCRVTFP